MAEHSVHEPRPKAELSRRQVIRRGMVVGGVALWSAPVVASAAWNRDDALKKVLDRLPQGLGSSVGPVAGPGPVATPLADSCTGYPAGTCLEFVCGGDVSVCGSGPDGTQCFCDVDIEGRCVCRNDATCSDLDTCDANSDCPDGWFCIPTSCCGGARCAPPCGVSAD